MCVSDVRVSCGETGDVELELSDDPFKVSRLDVSNLPTLVTVNKVHFLFVC